MAAAFHESGKIPVAKDRHRDEVISFVPKMQKFKKRATSRVSFYSVLALTHFLDPTFSQRSSVPERKFENVTKGLSYNREGETSFQKETSNTISTESHRCFKFNLEPLQPDEYLSAGSETVIFLQ